MSLPARPPAARARVARPGRAVVLLVEDNPGDAELAREVLADGAAIGDVHVVSDGAEALAFLRRSPHYADSPRPDLILLDLNLPRVSGHEVLAAVRDDPALRDICVVVTSSSAAPADVEQAYRSGADAYVQKALTLDAHVAGLRSVERIWAAVVGAG